MTIKSAIRQVLQDRGKVSNYDLEVFVRQRVNCCSQTIHRKRRQMDDVVGEQVLKQGKKTNTWMYSLA